MRRIAEKAGCGVQACHPGQAGREARCARGCDAYHLYPGRKIDRDYAIADIRFGESKAPGVHHLSQHRQQLPLDSEGG